MKPESMDLFVRYDLERLEKYSALAQNAPHIQTRVTTDFALLRFAEVNYFNYGICYVADQIAEVVQETKAFYQHAPHRLLVDDGTEPAYLPTLLTQQGYVRKGRQVLLRAPNQFTHLHAGEAATKLERVSSATLRSFTQDYLAGFESDRTDPEPVARNFGQLLDSSTIQLYRVMGHQRPVGIAALYQENGHFLLAGGAILPPFRKQGYHTGALLNRLQYCYQHQPKSISAWAYQDSISYQNMRRLGLTPFKRYWIYEHQF